MFTGIVEELGRVEHLEHAGDSARLSVSAPSIMDGTRTGDSVNVSGCCLTVTEARPDGFTADLMAETLERTDLGDLAPGSTVNLERALRPTDRMGGHVVQGHVDAAVTVLERRHEERWDLLRLSLPAELARYVAVKGSVTLDGVSLTVVDVCDSPSSLSVSLIPETLRRTTLRLREPGDRVNLEVDVMAKYVGRLLGADTPKEDR